MGEWVIGPKTTNQNQLVLLPAISQIKGLAKKGETADIEIEGLNFSPNSYPVIDWQGTEGNINSFSIKSPNLCTCNITAPTVTGNFPIEMKTGKLTSADWGSVHELKIVDFQTGWIDLTSAGPSLGTVESVINESLATKELSNSGFLRDENGITKDPAVGSQRPIILFKDFSIPVGASFSVILSDYRNTSYPVLGIFFDYGSFQKDVFLSTYINNYRAYFYLEDPGATNKFCVITPNYLTVITNSGIDCLINFKYLITSVYLLEFYRISSYGNTHEENQLELICKKKFVIQDGAFLKPSFLGLSFYSSNTSISSHFKAFKIF